MRWFFPYSRIFKITQVLANVCLLLVVRWVSGACAVQLCTSYQNRAALSNRFFSFHHRLRRRSFVTLRVFSSKPRPDVRRRHSHCLGRRYVTIIPLLPSPYLRGDKSTNTEPLHSKATSLQMLRSNNLKYQASHETHIASPTPEPQAQTA